MEKKEQANIILNRVFGNDVKLPTSMLSAVEDVLKKDEVSKYHHIPTIHCEDNPYALLLETKAKKFILLYYSLEERQTYVFVYKDDVEVRLVTEILATEYALDYSKELHQDYALYKSYLQCDKVCATPFVQREFMNDMDVAKRSLWSDAFGWGITDEVSSEEIMEFNDEEEVALKEYKVSVSLSGYRDYIVKAYSQDEAEKMALNGEGDIVEEGINLLELIP